MADLPSRVTCGRCNEPLLVWVDGARFYIGCAYNGCPLTALPKEADNAVVMATRPTVRDAARGGA